MNTNIVILVLQLFYILPKFQEEIKYLMIVLQRLCKKKIIPSTTPIRDNKDRPYAKNENFNQNLVYTNHTLIQTLKQELAEIFLSKEKAFCMKATV